MNTYQSVGVHIAGSVALLVFGSVIGVAYERRRYHKKRQEREEWRARNTSESGN